MAQLDWVKSVFNGFNNLVEIELCGSTVLIPENNSLLRGFQFINEGALRSGQYCWNGECSSCMVQVLDRCGESRRAMACRIEAKRGMVVSDLCDALRSDLEV